MADLDPVVPATVPCKCCPGIAALFGVVDFNKNCEAARNRFPLPMSGIPIYYHRCANCKLIFTVMFDAFTLADFGRHIYNDSYIAVDPDYMEARPLHNAKSVLATFGKTPNISILDYGGGNGKLATMLRQAGFTDTTTFDPFVPAHSILPDRKFDLILAYEVLEHTPTPARTLEEMNSLRAKDGMFLFSTLTQPTNIDQQGLNWWYAAPRNGHVTLYSISALQKFAERLGLNVRSSGE